MCLLVMPKGGFSLCTYLAPKDLKQSCHKWPCLPLWQTQLQNIIYPVNLCHFFRCLTKCLHYHQTLQHHISVFETFILLRLNISLKIRLCGVNSYAMLVQKTHMCTCTCHMMLKIDKMLPLNFIHFFFSS